MPALIGAGLAVAVVIFARLVGLDRDRAFYPVVLIIVGSYYVLFAVMAGGAGHLPPELLMFGLFAAGAVLGFRTSLWIVAVGLAAHGLFDFVRGDLLPGVGIPARWPAFCGAFDLTAAVLLAAMILWMQRKARPAATA